MIIKYLKGAKRVKRIDGAEYEIDKNSLPREGEIVVLKPVRGG